MFSLSEIIEDTIEFDGENRPLDMSFDNIINVQNLILDEKEDSYFKVVMTLVLMMDIDFEELIETYDFDYLYETFNSVLEYLGFKSKKTEDEEPDSDSAPKKVFDYKQDAEAIYASFFYAYQLDLIDAKGQLHYFKFKALLENLPEDASFSKILGYRTMAVPSSKESSKDYIKHVRKMKQLYKLEGDEVLRDPSEADYGAFNKKIKG